ncbi:MAG: hypothetical protein ACLFRE_09465, partial [Desulfovermiculus sp.]
FPALFLRVQCFRFLIIRAGIVCELMDRFQVSAPPLANLKYFFAPKRAKKKRLGEEGFFTRRLVQNDKTTAIDFSATQIE